MNNARVSDNSLSPTYMTQDEANALMELWAERQREEAARQSLITVHDVAEATQMSTQDVERLLQEVRSARPSQGPGRYVSTLNRSNSPESSESPTLLAAYIKLAPFTAALSLFLAICVDNVMRPGAFSPFGRNLVHYLAIYAVCAIALCLYRYLKMRWNDQGKQLLVTKLTRASGVRN